MAIIEKDRKKAIKGIVNHLSKILSASEEFSIDFEGYEISARDREQIKEFPSEKRITIIYK